MKSFISLIIVLFVVSLTLTFTACEKKGTAQKAGEKIDQAVEKTSETVKDTANKVEESLKK
ncbi:MAG: hypothetical protein P1P74_05135 [Desulfuromonadales bacterium]|nr:hypothetical protein [Desulfuromonadales bacterium]